MTDEAAVQETVDYVAITRLQQAYGDAVNRRAWDAFDELFLPDAAIHVDTVTNPAVDVTGPAALAAFIAGAIERFEFFEFVVLNAHVELRAGGEPDRATARVFMCELRQEQLNGHWSNAFGVYRDEYARVDDRWWFARRRYRSLARTGRAEVFPFPTEGAR